MDIQKGTKSNTLIDKTFVLAALPAYIYFVSFLYEMGFCDRFNIPRYLIQPSLTTILIFTSSLWLIIGSSFKLMGFAAPLIRGAQDESKKHLRGIYVVNFATIIILIVIYFSFPFSWTLLLIMFSFLFFINAFTWGLNWLLRIREKKSFKEKLENINSEVDIFDLSPLLLTGLTNSHKYIISTLVLLPGLCYFVGLGQSYKQVQYEPVSNRENIVVLKKYDDILICSPFDLKSRTLGDSLILYKIGPDKEVILKVGQFGPLNPKK